MKWATQGHVPPAWQVDTGGVMAMYAPPLPTAHKEPTSPNVSLERLLTLQSGGHWPHVAIKFHLRFISSATRATIQVIQSDM